MQRARLQLHGEEEVNRYPDIHIQRKDNGWVYSLRQSASSETQGVHPDGTPLVLKFWGSGTGIVAPYFTLTLEEDK